MILRLLAAFVIAISGLLQGFAATTLLPNGQQCFQTATGAVSSGSVNMYQPGTTTPKTTWKDAGQVTANAQPIQLDANGCAVIYGTGSYRQQVYTGPVVNNATSGSLVFDLTTTDTSANNNYFWAGLATGTPNAITVTDAGFNATDGSVIAFTALSTNTGPTTINPSSFGAITVKKDTVGGPQSLVGGEIVQNNPVEVVYRANDNAFHILNSLVLVPFNPNTGTIVVTGQCYFQYVSATSVQLIPRGGSAITIAGSLYAIPAAGISANPTSTYVTGVAGQALLANTLYDVYVFNNAGTLTLDFYAVSTKNHATDTAAGNVGIEILTGNNSRSYVGKVNTSATAQFQAQGVGTISWYNRRLISISQPYLNVSGFQTTSTSWVEVNSTARVNFLTFGDMASEATDTFNAVSNLGAVSGVRVGVFLDCNVNCSSDINHESPGGFDTVTGDVGIHIIARAMYRDMVSEGQHYFTPALQNGINANQVAAVAAIDQHILTWG